MRGLPPPCNRLLRVGAVRRQLADLDFGCSSGVVAQGLTYTRRPLHYDAPSSLILGVALLVGADDAPPPFDEEKRLVKLGRRVVEVVEGGGGEPRVGRSNRLPFSERRGEVGPLLEGEPAAGPPPGPAAPCPASLSRNSIHRFEKDCKRSLSAAKVVSRSSGRWLLTSFSTPSSSTAFPFPLRACPLAPARPLEMTLLDERAPEARWRPTFSRWSSVQERIDAMSCSISNRFESPRGVVMKVMRTFDTRRLHEGTPASVKRLVCEHTQQRTGPHCSLPSPA